jgi:hypothetical protein
LRFFVIARAQPEAIQAQATTWIASLRSLVTGKYQGCLKSTQMTQTGRICADFL